MRDVGLTRVEERKGGRVVALQMSVAYRQALKLRLGLRPRLRLRLPVASPVHVTHAVSSAPPIPTT